ncbi:MAG: class I SAM-dependent methyltransferase [Gammaproteobacteria bacterium]|nr:class I SAM-dependent methyltransferase [Gammaproteobacteria bacterium]MDH5652067.1 class I SAM-dependent methyltransferase [Gammaproteobacteria bacterium]
MAKTYFEEYGERARTISSETVISGRYALQEEAERKIVLDLADKLKIESSDSVLEIGCGVGNLLIPLSFFVNDITGIDHETVIGRLKNRYYSEKITLLAGTLEDQKIDGQFDKIIIYSVLHYMKDTDALFAFIDKACSLLKDSGRMLLGDISCLGRKDRFVKSQQGQAFLQEWNAAMSNMPQSPVFESNQELVEITDELVMDILLHVRKKGFHSYLVEQPADLPFGNTREDILIVGPEWKRK